MTQIMDRLSGITGCLALIGGVCTGTSCHHQH